MNPFEDRTGFEKVRRRKSEKHRRRHHTMRMTLLATVFFAEIVVLVWVATLHPGWPL